MQVTRVLTVGRFADRELGRSNFTARVIGTGSRATYLEEPEGEILWLSPPGSILHRRCVLVPLDKGSLREGDVCRHDGSVLRCGRHVLIALDGAVWEAAPSGSASVTSDGGAAALTRGLGALTLRYQPRGLAQLVFGFAASAQRLGRAGEGQMGGWLDLASGRVRDGVRALRARDAAGLLRAGSALVGLGEGLTPSGDDFLGGLLFGLRQQECADFDETWIDRDMVRDWVTSASMLTNRISHAILSDLAAGYGPEPLHALARETLMGGSCEGIARQAERVIRIGHTSGWDMLAGLSAALLSDVPSTENGDVAARRERRPLVESSGGIRMRIAAGGIHGS